jgi:hypothetical protein
VTDGDPIDLWSGIGHRGIDRSTEPPIEEHGDGGLVLTIAFDQGRFLPLNLPDQGERQGDGGCSKK